MENEIQPLLEDIEETEEKTIPLSLNTSKPMQDAPLDAQTSFDLITKLSDGDDDNSSDGKKDKGYDIFISHASDDIEEVKVLCEELENKFRFKCVLADRDFDAGVPIENNLKLKMEQSKKILLIISPGFVESYWCKFEMTRAFMMMSSGKKDLIIPVRLKPVMTEMPPFLEYYTYIDASKVDDLSYKIFETFYNPKIVDRADSIREKVLPLTPEEVRNQNGARLLTRLCRKKSESYRGVAWTFPPIDELAYEPDDILQIYDEVKDLLNDSFAFRWYGIMFNGRRQVIISIIAFLLGFVILPVFLDIAMLIAGRLENFPKGDWLYAVYLGIALITAIIVFVGINVFGKKFLTAVERKLFDFCLKERRDSSVIALVKDESNFDFFARPIALVLIRYNLEQCENFIFEFLKTKAMTPLSKESVDRRIQEFIFKNRHSLVYWKDGIPVAEVNRHNTWLQKQCVCEIFVSVHS